MLFRSLESQDDTLTDSTPGHYSLTSSNICISLGPDDPSPQQPCPGQTIVSLDASDSTMRGRSTLEDQHREQRDRIHFRGFVEASAGSGPVPPCPTQNTPWRIRTTPTPPATIPARSPGKKTGQNGQNYFSTKKGLTGLTPFFLPEATKKPVRLSKLELIRQAAAKKAAEKASES